jgi:hypothetical protein
MDPPADHSAGSQAAAPAANPQLSPLEQAKANQSFLAVQGMTDPVKVFAEPRSDAEELKSFPLRGEVDELITFWAHDERVDETGNSWYQVQLPARPNGSKGWVRALDVVPFELTNNLVIDLSDFRLDVFERGQKIRSYPIGLGRADTPTPLGEYYITVKMQPPDPNTVYGVLAMGVSAFSDKLTDWPGGGQVGIHGTNDPEGSIGKNVSHGCIRLRNEDITELTDLAPMGTPVFIQQ